MISPDATAAAAGRDTDDGRLAQRVAAFSRSMYERGWMPGTSGNLSARLPGPAGHALITASGRDKGDLTDQDMVVVDADTGKELRPGALRASAETSIHAAVYRVTGARAVIHVHAPYATAVACRVGSPEITTLPLARFELLKGLHLDDPARTELPVVPNHPQVQRIADDVAGYLTRTPQAPPGLLIADHGITAWGSDLAQARNHLECLESICQMLLLGAGQRMPAPADAPGKDTR